MTASILATIAKSGFKNFSVCCCISAVGFFFFPANVSGFIHPPLLSINKPAPAAVYYIDAGAADGGNGSMSSPWNDIKDADGAVVPGALIKIKGTFGDLDDCDSIRTWNQSGVIGNEIVFEPWGSEQAIILYSFGIGWNGTGNNIIFDGGPQRNIIFDGHAMNVKYNIQVFGDNITLYRIKSINNHTDAALTTGLTTGTNISVAGGRNTHIYNCEIASCVSVGIYPQKSEALEIKNNLIHDNGGTGIQINPHSAGTTVIDTVISGNAIYENGKITDRGGIIVTNTSLYDDCFTTNTVITNNFIWGSYSLGIKIGEGNMLSKVGGVKIYNNTVYGSGAAAIYLAQNDENYSDTIVYNNLIWANNPDIIDGTYTGSNNLLTNPFFLSANSEDNVFLLINELSPAYNTGADLYSVGVVSDYLGTTRPQYDNFDIGAFEYNSMRENPLPPEGLRIILPDYH